MTTLQEAEAVPALRRPVRLELYRRLYHARDFMHAHLDQPLTLERISGAACLSRCHFLRIFRQLFGLTPHQYLTEKRLQKALTLLQDTNEPVTAIGLSVG